MRKNQANFIALSAVEFNATSLISLTKVVFETNRFEIEKKKIFKQR